MMFRRPVLLPLLASVAVFILPLITSAETIQLQVETRYLFDSPDIVIFQKRKGAQATDKVIAWRVIKNLSNATVYPFSYTSKFNVSAIDAYDSQTPSFPATKGQRWDFVSENMIDTLKLSPSPASNGDAVEIFNAHPYGPTTGVILRDGKRLAETMIPPNQKASFEFEPRLFIGVVRNVREGSAIPEYLFQDHAFTGLDLNNLSSATIVMKGDRQGQVTFSLQDIVQN